MKRSLNKNSILFVISLATFTDAFLYGSVLSLLPLYATLYNLNQMQLGIIISSYAVALLFGTYPLGRLADSAGRRTTLLWGSSTLFAATSIFIFTNSYPFLIIARVIQGLSATITWTAGMASISDYFEKDSRGQAMGITISLSCFGALLGLTLSGWLHQHYNNLRTSFLIVGILVITDTMARIIILKDKANNSNLNTKISLRDLARNPTIQIFAGSIIVVSGLIALLEAKLPIHLNSIKMAPTTIGICLSVAPTTNMIVSVFIGYISNKFGRKKVLIYGLLLTAACIPLPLFIKSTLGIISYMILIGTASSLILSSANPAIANVVEYMNSGNYGSAFIISNTTRAIGIIAGPILGSALLQTIETKWALGGVWIAMGLYILLVRKVDLI